MECRLTIDHRPSDNDEATVNDGRQVRVKNPQKIFRTMVAGITSAIRDDVEGIGILGGGQPDKRNLVKSHHRHLQRQRVAVRA